MVITLCGHRCNIQLSSIYVQNRELEYTDLGSAIRSNYDKQNRQKEVIVGREHETGGHWSDS